MAHCAGSLLSLLLLLLVPGASSRSVTIFNDRPRYDVAGNIVDAHDGNIVYHAGTFFLYGEAYGNLTGTMFRDGGWGAAPQLAVYTSPDLTAWTYRGSLFNASVPATPAFTKWIPTVLFSPACECFVLWFGSGGWGVATSADGIHFALQSSAQTSRLGGSTDGTGLLLDDDGAGYIAFAALSTGGALGGGHLVSIERLAPDLLSSSKVNVTGFFPLDYTESPSLFKRGGRYYALLSSCCCACRGGSGLAVFSAPSVQGPWTLQQGARPDINCGAAGLDICGAFGARTAGRADLVWNAQWWSVSAIPLAGGGSLQLLAGRRWLSGAGNAAGCDDMCWNGGNFSACVNPRYQLRGDLDVWVPLEFGADGSVLPLRPLPSFTIELP